MNFIILLSTTCTISGTSLESDNLLVVYFFMSPQVCPDKRGGLWLEGLLYLQTPNHFHRKSQNFLLSYITGGDIELACDQISEDKMSRLPINNYKPFAHFRIKFLKNCVFYMSYFPWWWAKWCPFMQSSSKFTYIFLYNLFRISM